VSSCALVVWAAAAGSAVAFPGMAACRVPDRWMTLGWCPSPARNPDRGHRRHPDRPGQDSRRSPSARLLATGFAARMTDPVRHAAARLVGQASLGSRPYRRLSAGVSRAVDHRELPCRPGAARCPGCRAVMIARVRLPGRRPPDGPGGGPVREHVAEGGGSAARFFVTLVG